MKQLRRLCLLAAIFLSGTAVAHAHSELLTAVPAPGSTLTNPVGDIRLTFNEPISEDSSIILFAENFQMTRGIMAEVEETMPTVLYTAVPPLAPGNYTVQWTAVSADGHSSSGSYAFRVVANRWSILLPQLALLSLGIVLLAGIVLLWRRVGNR